MRHFTTKTGETLGTTFAGTAGRTLMQTKEEEKLMWSLSEDSAALEDDSFEWKLGDLMDFFFKECTRATKEEMTSRGWEDRFESGLSMRTGLSNDGQTFLMR